MTQGRVETSRLSELEGLRGLLAWWVVVGHLLFIFSERLGLLSRNRSAVDVFIILSGFVVYRLIDTRQEPYPVFITRRFFRLYPAYILVLLASAATLGLQRAALMDSPFFNPRTEERLAIFDATSANLWPHLAAHLTMLHGLVPMSALSEAATSIVGQAWSISVEWQYYLLAPLVFLGLKHGWKGRAAVALATIGLAALGQFGPLADNYAFIGRSVVWFAVGIGSYYAYKHRDRLPKAVAWSAVAALAASSVATRSPAGLLWAVMLVMILSLAPRATNGLAALLRSRPLTWLGGASYSTYMVHVLALYLTMSMLNRMHLDRLTYAAALTVICLGATAVLSAVMSRWVETPGMAFGTTLARRLAGGVRRPAPDGAVPEPSTQTRRARAF